MSGPLPNPQRRRRNAPTIPTTSLPASGRKGAAPKCPYPLRTEGTAWWRWAWSLPQATAWDAGALYVAARRASLEDDLAVLEGDDISVADVLGLDDDSDMARELDWLIGRLRSLASSRVSVIKEMRELDNKLGLSPEALAKLRWSIVDDAAKSETPAADTAPAAKKKRPPARRGGHLRPVDPALTG